MPYACQGAYKFGIKQSVSCCSVIFYGKERLVMKSCFMRFLGMFVWLVTALCAIHEGLKPFGYDFFAMNMFVSNPKLMLYTHYFLGLAGVISLVMFVLVFMRKGCHCCSNDNCSCCSKKSCEDGITCPKCGYCPCKCGAK